MTEQERDELLNALTPLQHKFVLAYVENGGNAYAAAQQAGYKNPHPEGARAIQKATVKAAIRGLTQPEREAEKGRIMEMAEIQAWWTAIIKGEEQPREGENLDRLSASDKLARSLGGYLDRSESRNQTEVIIRLGIGKHE